MIPSVWDHQAALARRLRYWAVGSVAAGAAAALAGRRGTRVRAFGVQTALWGAVNVVIATVADRNRRRKLARHPAPGAADVQRREARRLRWLLLLNATLEVGYVLTGYAIVRWSRGSAREAERSGHGLAMIIQGAYLLVLDVGHARGLRER